MSRHHTIEEIKIKNKAKKKEVRYFIEIIITTLVVKDKVLIDLIKGQGLTFTIWKGWCFIIYVDSDINIVSKIVKTYAWMSDTAISNPISIVWPSITAGIREFMCTNCELIKDIIRWPAVIFAINRTAKVNGRIILLVNSIKTINIIKLNGVSVGTRWESIFLVFLIHPKRIKLTHKGRAIDNVINIWLVEVKIKGINPKELLNMIRKNKGKNRVMAKCDLKVILGLSSLLIFFEIIFLILEELLENSQNEDGIRIIGVKKIIQFKFRLMIEEGSKIENILIIIFRSVYGKLSWIFLRKFWKKMNLR